MGFWDIFSGKNKTDKPAPQVNNTPVYAPVAAPAPVAKADFDQLISNNNFPEYSIETNLHPQIFDSLAHPSCLPISYLLRKDGVPALAVLVMKKNQYRAMIARGTYQVLDAQRIPYIRFYTDMENEASYVINRVKENL